MPDDRSDQWDQGEHVGRIGGSGMTVAMPPADTEAMSTGP